MPRFSFRRFDEVLHDVQEARRWYGSLGIDTAGSRLELIEAKTEALLADLGDATAGEVVNRWSNPDTYYALSDGAAFGRVARELGKSGPNLLPRKKLRTILEGPLSPHDESSLDGSVNARNFFTELELAADLSEKGVSPTGFDDLQFHFRGVDYSIQCKRLISSSRVRENIAEAYEQLKNNLRTDHERGLIALAVEKVMGLDTKILRLTRAEDLNVEVRNLIEEFRTTFGHPWWNFVDTRFVGVLLIVRFLCFTVSRNVIGPAYYLVLASLVAPELLQASELERLRSLVDYLRLASEPNSTPL
jgi:hypothetical protein